MNLSTSNTTIAERLAILSRSEVASTLADIKHGVEREALRVGADGGLANTPHPRTLGSALTHDSITTDFSESLLEFITPPERDIKRTLMQLADEHKYVMDNIGEERLWPLSMPCYVSHEDEIPIAQYGKSNIGKMKTLYRVGLKNRYGSLMQAIAGVHFNFSLPETFWHAWLNALEGVESNKETRSAGYFSLIRNYRRFCWLIPYLYGSSPAICGSFIEGKESSLPFKRVGKGSLYLPYATSLRMSDLGYTSSAQSDLMICYNEVESYIQSVRSAINTPSPEYAKFNHKHDGEYQQLNANVLQIENELYSPIRPKQPALTLEKPTDALDKRGVSYIEVRALDVNPFSPLGIEENQFYFLDVFLLYCAIAPSAMMTSADFKQTEQNLAEVVLYGRKPGLELNRGDDAIKMQTWAAELFEGMREVAKVLDAEHYSSNYSNALEQEWQKVLNPELTHSGRMLKHLLDNDLDNGVYGLQMAQQYKDWYSSRQYRVSSEQDFVRQAEASLIAQQEKERADSKSFEQFLADYFSYETSDAWKKLA